VFDHQKNHAAITILALVFFAALAACSSGTTNVTASPTAAQPPPAASIPTAPANLSATPGNAQVNLTWTMSSGAMSYRVKRAMTASGPYGISATASSTSYTDASLANGTRYYYVVSAVDSAGESANSSPVAALPAAPPAVLAAPTGLATKAGNAQVSLQWNISSGASSYHVKRATTSGGTYTQMAAPTAASYVDSGAANGTAYYYVVSALDSAGESANSAPVSAVPAAPIQIPPVPTGVSAAAGSAQVTLSWSASSSATSYHLNRATVSGGPYTQVAAPTSTSYTDSLLTNGTRYYYVVSALDSAGESANSSEVNAIPVTPSANTVMITVASSTTQPISPYIYGSNSIYGRNQVTDPIPPQLTLDRAGGNSWTTYNWENNFNNAGSDYQYDNYLYLSNSSTPAGGAITAQIAADRAAGMATMMTFPLQGLVAADNSGPVIISTPPNPTRFKTVIYQKSTQSSAPFTTTPPTTDAYVYMDEFASAVDQYFSGQGIFSGSPATYPVFAQLDNEPDIWNSTHLEVQGATNIAPSVFFAKTIALATALKTKFPNMTIFGPVNFGFSGFFNWQGAVTAATPTNNNWFFDEYCAAMATASASFGRPLVDVYDFHWYSYVNDPAGSGNYITSLNGSTLTAAQVQAIAQSPRSLWDTTFTETSWITQDTGIGPISLLPRLRAKIAAENSGMKLSITEYNNGGGNHIAGTIAQADNLGIFGAQGLFAASFWQLVSGSTGQPYALAGFRAYRDFDGAGSNFGDVSVAATSSNTTNVSAYISTDSTRPGRVVMVLINRSVSAQNTTVSGQVLSGTAHLWQTTAASAQAQAVVQPVAAGSQPVSGSSLTVSLPALSVTTIDTY
jgi:fibronectin type 3 domain-containing protein